MFNREKLICAAWGLVTTSVLAALIVIGSRNLDHFDAALVGYTFATLFATFGITYRYAMWLRRPPTRMYWRRGWRVFLRPGFLGRNLVTFLKRFTLEFAANRFIWRRGRERWAGHWLIMWGCIIAAAITFPLVFGWIHFGSLDGDPRTYVTYVFGFPTLSFRVRTAFSWLLFHGLDVAAVLVLAGIGLSLWRRMRDRGALAVQSFAMDFFPLILLFAISVTGLALTTSTLWLRGQFYGFLSILHAITVIAALLYLPFGKFFHILQRPAQLGVKLYQDAGEAGEGAHCARCGERFASRMQIDDLAAILPQLGFDYRMPGPAATWQELCPACKRKTIALAQLRMKDATRG